MAKKIKDYYDLPYADMLADKICKAYPRFDKVEFLGLISDTLETLPFNERQTLIAKALKQCIREDYAASIHIFQQILGPELLGSLGMFTEGYWLWPIGRYVELYGTQDFAVSTAFSKELTKRFTGEFCMRPLIVAFPQQSMQLLLDWSKDENKRVRRLASECLRIRLPWAKKLYAALDHFDVYVQILSNLKEDADRTIQKSVANNLNDLYKEDVQRFEQILAQWQSESLSKECAWIIHHASRSRRKKESLG